MSIGSIDSSNAWSQQSGSTQTNWQNILSAASDTLGLSTSALQQQLQSGSSLTSIAQTQGVSQQTLVSSIEGALTQNGSAATGSQLQSIATTIANRTPGSGGHHHHHAGGATDGSSSTSGSTDSTDSTSSSSNDETEDELIAALTGDSSPTSSLLSALTGDSSSPSSLLSTLGSSYTSSGLLSSGLDGDAAASQVWQGIDELA
jgi:hypothetical protein